MTRILPFRVGELSLSMLLYKRLGINLIEGALLTLWLRLLELVCLAPSSPSASFSVRLKSSMTWSALAMVSYSLR